MSATGHRCPKCGRHRADAGEACARCGLVFERWAEDQTAREGELDTNSAVLWEELQPAWQDEARHEAFLKRCAKMGVLPAAGRAYRGILDKRPNDAIATRMQARIVGMATAALLPMKSTPPVAATKGRWFLWVVAIGTIVGVLAGLFFQTLSD